MYIKALTIIYGNSDSLSHYMRKVISGCVKTTERTISVISLPIKILVRIILNRLKKLPEETLAEEQGGF